MLSSFPTNGLFVRNVDFSFIVSVSERTYTRYNRKLGHENTLSLELLSGALSLHAKFVVRRLIYKFPWAL